jgi:hypothetical protein
MKQWMIGSALLLIGCGASGVDIGNATIDSACGDIAKAKCDKVKSCTNGAGISRSWGDMTTCLAREKLSCTLVLQVPMNGNTPAATEQCVAAYASYSCADYFSNQPPAACIHMGTGPSGAPCAVDGQCQSGFCLGIKTALCGTCGDAPPEGASCLHDECAHGQNCVSRSQACNTPGAEGAACDNNSAPCAADLQCAATGGTMTGTCVTTSSSSGAACNAAMSTFCDGYKGLACSPSHNCAEIPLGADGAPCGSISGAIFSECAGGGACYTATGIAQSGEMGNCKAPAADGAACDILLGPPCLSPARCVVGDGGSTGTCTLLSGNSCG